MALKESKSTPALLVGCDILAKQAIRGSGSSQSLAGKRIAGWEKVAENHKFKQLINPFSDWEGASHRPVMDKNDPNYGIPVEGSLTYIRGKQAQAHITQEIVDMCHVIKQLGIEQPDGTYTITFGRLFNAYTRISDKCVGILLRARKHGYVDFEGEMLYQGQDEKVVITCKKVPEQNMAELNKYGSAPVYV